MVSVNETVPHRVRTEHDAIRSHELAQKTAAVDAQLLTRGLAEFLDALLDVLLLRRLGSRHVFAIRNHLGGNGRVKRTGFMSTGALRLLIVIEPGFLCSSNLLAQVIQNRLEFRARRYFPSS
jgi:hypothetical protein